MPKITICRVNLTSQTHKEGDPHASTFDNYLYHACHPSLFNFENATCESRHLIREVFLHTNTHSVRKLTGSFAVLMLL